jgi:glycosyltransferase involved in cell wall biosynthesis
MKGLEAFIDAASLIAGRHPTCEFVCMGEGAKVYKAELEARSAARGLDNRMHWVDAAPDMERVYPALDLLVSTSRYGEGFPNVVAEGMACGVPALVTDSGDSSLVVGDAGWLLPASADASEIAVHIEHALEEIAGARSDLSRHARDRIVTEFSVAQLVSRTLAAVSR